MSVLVATDFDADEQAGFIDLLRGLLPHERFVQSSDGEVDVAIVANPPEGALQGLPGLKLIQSMWAGADRLLRDPTLPKDVPLARMVDPAMNRAMAETALWAVLSLHRRFFDYAAQQRATRWQLLPQPRADEVSVLVLGLGEMGRTAAMTLASHGYHVSGWSTRETNVDGVRTAHGEAGLATLLAAADIVINLLPLTPATQGFFDASRLARLKPGASLVNLARGAHVVDADLLAALASGRVSHAVLDVFRTEPLPADHPYWHHPAVTVLPHAAAQTDLRSATAAAVANVRALREGRPLANLVDRQRGY
jgi:glyoxylate/hydroxypyruvate reductase